MRPDEHDVLVSINPESLLLEGARRVDEWSLIEKKVPSFDLIFELDAGRLAASESQLTSAAAAAHAAHRWPPRRHGAHRRVGASATSRWGRRCTGSRPRGSSSASGKSRPQDDVVREARVEEHRNLGVAFYRTAMFEEATREFRRVVELQDSDVQARFFLSLVSMREGRWSEAVLTLREAAAQPTARPVDLSQSRVRARAARQSRRGARDAARGDRARRRRRSAHPHVVRRARAPRRATSTRRMRRFASARALLGKRLPSPAWFHYASLAAGLAGDLDRALELITEGVKAHPHAAVLGNTLAAVHERRGDFAAAAQAAECGAGRRRHAFRSCTRIWATTSIARSGTRRRSTSTSARSRSTPRSATTSTSSSATSASSGRRRSRRSPTGSARSRSIPTNEILRTNLELARTQAS